MKNVLTEFFGTLLLIVVFILFLIGISHGVYGLCWLIDKIF